MKIDEIDEVVQLYWKWVLEKKVISFCLNEIEIYWEISLKFQYLEDTWHF